MKNPGGSGIFAGKISGVGEGFPTSGVAVAACGHPLHCWGPGTIWPVTAVHIRIEDEIAKGESIRNAAGARRRATRRGIGNDAARDAVGVGRPWVFQSRSLIGTPCSWRASPLTGKCPRRSPTGRAAHKRNLLRGIVAVCGSAQNFVLDANELLSGTKFTTPARYQSRKRPRRRP